MKLDFDVYREKVRGCFIGKTVGGTLGMKYEGNTAIHDVTYYDPVPTEMLPNDDLDLQVVNLENIIRTGLPVCRYNLGETWQYHMTDSVPDEYGVSIYNHTLGLHAPLSGKYGNKFTAGMGAAIRSELWACLAPANPRLASLLAREDACNDHDADGVYAEMFLAAVESMAFAENDLEKIVNEALDCIPEGNRLKNALCDVFLWWKEEKDVLAIREKILEKYGVQNFTDVTINLAFIFLALVSCDGSFDKAVCTAVSLGYDTDCTGATVGSVFGILNPSLIDKKWTDPIGDELVLGHCVINMHPCGTIGAFCEKITDTAIAVQKHYHTDVELGQPTNYVPKTVLSPSWTEANESVFDWANGANESLIATRPFMLTVCYPESVSALPGEKTEYSLRITNTASVGIQNAKITLCVPDGWQAEPRTLTFDAEKGETVKLPFTVIAEKTDRRANLNLLSLLLNVGGLEYEFRAGLPLSKPWTVENIQTGSTVIFEESAPFFTVPEGEYRYRTTVYTVKKQVRAVACGTRPFKLFINGEQVLESEGRYYIPAFHRSWNHTVTVALNNGGNTVEVVFSDGKAGEFFMAFGSLYGCGEWVSAIERGL